MPKFKNVLQIKVALKNFKPSIFRTFYFPADSGFMELHTAIQEVMGWDTAHLFAFRKGRDLEIGIPTTNDFFNFNYTVLDISKTKLKGFLESPKDTINYEYDFGDSWEHKVDVQKVFSEIELPQLPFCIKGANACPIEDCGGVWGYANILEILNAKKHPDYEEMNEWYDFENLKPYLFDIAEINDQLLDFKECIDFQKSVIKEIKSSI